MTVLEHGDLHLSYWVEGDGFPLLLFAPGGMHSVASLWGAIPAGGPMPWFDPRTSLSADFRVVSMDQRHAGASTAEVGPHDGWTTYTADHLALMDALSMARAHVMGGCFGASLCLSLCEQAPDRVSAAVLQNPIGTTGENRHLFLRRFDEWAASLREGRPEVRPEMLDAMRENMYGADFVFSVTREFVSRCPVPLLVLAGNDENHPREVSEEIVDLAPDAELMVDWRGPELQPAVLARVREFLLDHTFG